MSLEFNKAETYRKKYKYKDAASLYENILSRDSGNLDSLIGLAECMLNLERNREVYDLCNKAIGIKPDLVLPHTILSYMYGAEGNLIKSREEAEFALKLDKDSAEANCCYGTLLLDENKLDDAELFLKKALSIDPSLYLAHYNLSIVYQMKNKLDMQLQQCKTLLNLKPNYRNLIYYLGLYVSISVPRRLLLYLTPFLFVLFENYLLFLPHLILIWLFISSGLLSMSNNQKSIAKNRFVMMSFLVFSDVIIILVAKTN